MERSDIREKAPGFRCAQSGLLQRQDDPEASFATELFTALPAGSVHPYYFPLALVRHGPMLRREFVTLVGAAAFAWPLSARAQQPPRQRRIALFHPAIPTRLLTETGGGSAWRAFFRELRRLGYVEGENLIIERYSAEGHHERYADLAREIVARIA